MIDTRHIHIKDYNYELPDERIAKYPLPERDSSKLLLYKHGQISHTIFRQLPEQLKADELMVFNNTRVIQARLHFRKTSGALIEVFCLEPYQPHDYALMFTQTGSCQWLCMVGNLKKWKEGPLSRTIEVGNRSLELTATHVGTKGTSQVISFDWHDPQVTFAEVLEACGELPIPPYLNRATEESDLTTYQTVYSKIKGSVAAPTAGLHFTDRVLEALDAHGIERDEITLHVGAGTFKPVKSEEIEGHTMHAEWIVVSQESIRKLIAHQGQCIAVGTTSVRTLESLYYVGVKYTKIRISARTNCTLNNGYRTTMPNVNRTPSAPCRLCKPCLTIWNATNYRPCTPAHKSSLLRATRSTLSKPLSPISTSRRAPCCCWCQPLLARKTGAVSTITH